MKANPEPLLSLRDWSLVRHVPEGETTLLAGIDLDILAGCWTAVLGANGSGKSSLLKFLAAEESPLAETAAIMFQDPDEQIFAAGVARELTLGRAGLDGETILKEFGLEGLGAMDPRLLSAGQKQRLVLAVAMAGDPGVLFCDEPTALQDELQSTWVLDRLGRWRDATGGALVTATCDRAEAARADWLVVLGEGRILRQGPTSEMMASLEVEKLLGRGTPLPGDPIPVAGPSAPALLELQGLGCRFPGPGEGFRDVDLQLGPGQRVGVIGPNGCGKSTLLAACAGARCPDEGSVRLDGKKLYPRGKRSLDHGRAMIAPQFPEYLFTCSTVGAEMALDPALKSRDPGEFLEAMGLPVHLEQRNPHDLSSGQRRRLALGMVLHSGRRVLLLDEPTAALDRAGRDLILSMLGGIPADTALVIASHDRAFLQAAGCRIGTLGPAGLIFDEPTGTGP